MGLVAHPIALLGGQRETEEDSEEQLRRARA